MSTPDDALLRIRIMAMAKRWEYFEDELAEALSRAKDNPGEWKRLVDHEESKLAQKKMGR